MLTYDLWYHTVRKLREMRHPITMPFDSILVPDRQFSPHKQGNKLNF